MRVFCVHFLVLWNTIFRRTIYCWAAEKTKKKPKNQQQQTQNSNSAMTMSYVTRMLVEDATFIIANRIAASSKLVSTQINCNRQIVTANERKFCLLHLQKASKISSKRNEHVIYCTLKNFNAVNLNLIRECHLKNCLFDFWWSMRFSSFFCRLRCVAFRKFISLKHITWMREAMTKPILVIDKKNTQILNKM